MFVDEAYTVPGNHEASDSAILKRRSLREAQRHERSRAAGCVSGRPGATGVPVTPSIEQNLLANSLFAHGAWNIRS